MDVQWSVSRKVLDSIPGNLKPMTHQPHDEIASVMHNCINTATKGGGGGRLDGLLSEGGGAYWPLPLTLTTYPYQGVGGRERGGGMHLASMLVQLRVLMWGSLMATS